MRYVALSLAMIGLAGCQTTYEKQLSEIECLKGDVTICDKQLLCDLASGYTNNITMTGAKIWKPGMKKWGDEARRRGMNCGVK